MGYGIALQEAGEIDLYRFGRSQQVFRGPKPSLRNPYITFIGGSETFGKFVTTPFPKLVQKSAGKICVNWGTPGAGPGFFLKDPVLLEACSNAEVCVIQVMDAVPMANRMYSVFPRRNQRLRGVSEALKALYPQIDFTQYKYVSAMIRKLKTEDDSAWKVVEAELKSAWMARMLELLEEIETKKILLWLRPIKSDPMNDIISDDMISVISKKLDNVVQIEVPDKRSSKILLGGISKETGWMTRAIHEKVAAQLSPILAAMLDEDIKAVA